MALWSRLRQLKTKFPPFSKDFNRCYSLNHGPIIGDQRISSRTLIPVLNNTNLVAQSRKLELFSNIRFYASRTPSKKLKRRNVSMQNQNNQKKEEKDTEPSLNEEITAPYVRLVSDEGHNVVPRYEALTRARRLQMDLVLVDKEADPPVCKILDYNKEKIAQKEKEKERAKKTKLKLGDFKEVRFAAKINQKDLEMKANMVKRLMDSGHRVKCTAFDRTAIEPTSDLALKTALKAALKAALKTLLSRFTALIEDIAIMENEPQVSEKQAFVVVRHVKFGPKKGGSSKKASKANKSENQETEEIKNDSQESPNEDVQTTENPEWDVFDEDDDIEEVFNINDEVKSATIKPVQSPIVTGPPNHGMENRYARDPRAGIPSRDMNGRDARMRPPPQPAYDVPKQDSSQNSPAKSYGVFSTPKVGPTSSEQNGPVETNRYMRKDPPQRNYPPINRESQRR